MSDELPKIFSDEEFDLAVKARDKGPRSEQERWDNAGIRPPPQPGDGLPESRIEQLFPHIAEKLTVVWPSEACALYISDLVVNRRESRQGFPQEVLDDLLMLHEINDMLINAGKRAARNADPVPFVTPARLRRKS
jgi:hypothetical protein